MGHSKMNNTNFFNDLQTELDLDRLGRQLVKS